MSNERILSIAGHAELHVSTRSGRVTIEAEDRQDLLIESDAPLRDDKMEVDATGRVSIKSGRGGSGWLAIRCPLGADLAIGTVSGNAELRGQLGAVRITTVSGSVKVERAEALDVRSVAGSIEVGRCSGRCRLQTKSGRAVCASAGEARVSTMSGQIRLDDVRGSVRAESASGKVEIGVQGKGDVTVQTMSGSVKVALPRGVRPNARLRSLAGKPRCACEMGDDCEVAVRSLSGKIEVVPS